VERLHQIGYVHLDLKPDNFLLDVTKKQIKRLNDSANPNVIKCEEPIELNMRRKQFVSVVNFGPLIPSNVHLIDFGTAMSFISDKERDKMVHLPNIP
jgi:serine/threonine protein kinase